MSTNICRSLGPEYIYNFIGNSGILVTLTRDPNKNKGKVHFSNKRLQMAIAKVQY